MKMLNQYEGSLIEYEVQRQSNVMVKMRDGVALAADIYFPAMKCELAPGKFPVILERTPYNKLSPSAVTKAKYFAKRGYVCVIQDVRGRFRSDGEWYAFAKEANDGFDTVEWLGSRSWSNGKVGTMGDSYAGSDQSALATLNPPSLATMIIAVGASNYYHSSMRQNGALEQRFLIYAFRMAITSKEAESDPSLKASIIKSFTEDITDIVNQFPLREGTTVLRQLPSYERWAIDIATHGEYGDYWKQRGYAISEYYNEHADVPSLYLGGWYDSYARNTCESYMALSRMKSSPQHLLMGPWTHGQYEVTHSGNIDFGIDSHINYNDLKLAWFDKHLKDMNSEVSSWSPVRIFTMGGGSGRANILGSPGVKTEYPGRLDHGGFWRNEPDWPLDSTRYTAYYIHGGGFLSPEIPIDTGYNSTSFTFDPKDPVPTIGGGISAAEPVLRAGAFDQSGSPEFFPSNNKLPLNARADVLTYQTTLLEKDVDVTGPVEMHLWASSSALDTDFTAKLIDVYPPSSDFPEGVSLNITDSIIRARYRNGWDKAELMTPGHFYEFVFTLYPTSNVFKKGHRIRLDISSSNWPRFDVNPNTGGPLGVERRFELAHQTIYHDVERPSHIILPLQSD